MVSRAIRRSVAGTAATHIGAIPPNFLTALAARLAQDGVEYGNPRGERQNSPGNGIALSAVMGLHYHVVCPLECPETPVAAILEAESTLTDRYQTTVPESVRRALQLGKRDKIRYTICPDGAVVLTRAIAIDADDPVLEQFLGFLADDIARHPERLQSLDAGLVRRVQSLVSGVDIDLEATLAADDE